MEVLQRVMEHEIVHLVELLVWGESRSGAERSGSIAERFFGHTDHRHQLLPRAERVLDAQGIRPGDWVAFEHHGREHVGRVNRLTRRVTVLVEDPQGRRYSDGRRYAKFYVWADRMRPAPAALSKGT
ncbi:MAG: hypothetical protein KatS3mg111_3470 [Pirellulaceae bacterium]|nr:MAG: hypothetical protein KatS3mg111_3470 [Pirellulaceae bacterium]